MADGQHLLLPSRHGAGGLSAARGKFGKQGVDLVQRARDLLRRQDARRRPQIVVDAEPAEDAMPLGHACHAREPYRVGTQAAD